MQRLILGSRGSALALAQVELTKAALALALPALATEVKIFVTRGDKKLDLSLLRASEAGGKGLFTKELEDELLTGEIDVAVHSLKDLPGHLPPGLELAAVLERAPTADVLITKIPSAAKGLALLPPSACVGTSSIRRARQLRWLRPDLSVTEWRGNVQTRLRKLAESTTVAGIILAQAGLERLGYTVAPGQELTCEGNDFIVTPLGEYMLPAIGQGAIALEARADRPEVLAVVAAINHAATLTAVRAERELQRLLAGDCTLPVGVRTTLAGDELRLEGILFPSDEGAAPLTGEVTGPADAPEELAHRLFALLQP